MSNSIKPIHVLEKSHSHGIFRVPVDALYTGRVQETNQYLWIFTDTTDGYVEMVTIENHQQMLDDISSGFDEVVFQRADDSLFDRNYKYVAVEHWDVEKAVTRLKRLKPTDFGEEVTELYRYLPGEEEPVASGLTARVGISEEASNVADGILNLLMMPHGRFFNGDVRKKFNEHGIHAMTGESDSFGILTAIIYWDDEDGNTFAIIGG